MEKILTTCVYCGCGCGLYLHVDGGRVVGVSPSRKNAASKGRLCIKGWLSGDFVNHPDRLSYPMIRKGERQLRASWDEALSLVASSLTGMDPSAVGVLTSAKGTNEENYLFSKLARAGFKTNNVDHVARLCHAPTVTGLSYAFGSGATTNPISSLEEADAILVVGSNTTEQHPLVASYVLKARSKGTKLIVVDPRRTQIASLADIHISPRPGTDVAWINSLLNVIIKEGLADQDFITKRTMGFEAVKESVLSYAPEIVETICGVPAGVLREAALAYGSADKASIIYAMGITQHITGTDNVQALANLALATGNLGRPGTGLYPLRGHQNVQGACDMGALPDLYPGYQKVVDANARAKFEKGWSTKLPKGPGLTAVEMIQSAETGKIKGLLIIGENPMVSYPDRSSVRRALEKLEFLAVCDIFPTETSKLADAVLPAASFAEKEGTFTSTERRIQRIRKATDPPGESRSEWEVAAELLRRLGVPGDYSSPADIMEEISSLAPNYGGVTYHRLGAAGLQWPCPTRDHPGTEIMHIEKFPIGLARFRPVDHMEPAEGPDGEYPLLLTTGRCLYHFHTSTMTRRSPLLDREVPSPFVEVNPEDASRAGLRNGQKALVETRRGQLQLEVKVSPGVPRGILFVPFHFSEAPANLLTGAFLDPSSKIPELKISAARLRKVSP
jgi:formate dehydrogenase major subunit/formate dehydrogenase alpha subunit